MRKNCCCLVAIFRFFFRARIGAPPRLSWRRGASSPEPFMSPPERILSFDVGTRNFALCLVQRNPLAILEWEVIDTVTEGQAPAKGTIEENKRALCTL